MVVGFAGKEVRPTEETGHDQTSDILTIDTEGGRTIIQGIEEGRGWSANLDQSSGHLTVGVVGHGYTVSLVGECTVMPAS